jgi:glucuronokinase
VASIVKRSYARAGLLGNPSDGYNGKTIAISLRNFETTVELRESAVLEIDLAAYDRANFRSVHDLLRDVQMHGYYGGIRLIKATIKRFAEYCLAQNLPLHDRNFSIGYETDIPRQVGLAGSSSIITATLHCLLDFYEVEMPLQAQPTFVLEVETQELGIAAGLQDRVIQCYEGMVYMDFAKDKAVDIHGMTCYSYEPLTVSAPLPLYVAYHGNLSEPTETFHNDIRGRFNRGDQQVVDAMRGFADIAAQGREAILAGDVARLSALIDANFDLRHSIYKLPDWQLQMVETARQTGASAKFAGSGGAIIGMYRDEAMFEALETAFAALDCKVIQPALNG